MKRTLKMAALFVAITAIAVSCADKKPEKTIANLKAAITGETNASAKYQAFSEQAAEEGFDNIASMFAAASFAEAIHIKNHNAVLVALGEEPFNPDAETPVVEEIEDNLQVAIDGETYEFTVMYPGFIVDANAEKCEGAVKSFTWAKEAEAVHAVLYAEALEIIKMMGTDEEVSAEWYVCPVCGDLFNTIDGLDSCPICSAHSASFKKF